jgi:uncharacterized membrane protein YgcG
LTIWIVSAAVIVLLAAWTLFTALSTHRKSQYRGNLEYFRDLPPLSPAATTKLLDIIDRGTIPKPGNSTPEALSSTILSLASKKAIALLPGSSDLYDTELSDGKFTLNNLFSASSANTQEPRNAEDFTVVLLAEYQNPTAGANPALSSSEQAALEFLKFLGEQVGQLYFDFDQANDALKNSLDDASTTSLAHHANRLLQQVQVAGLKELTATKAYQPKSGRNASWALLLVASLAAAFLYSWTGQVFIALVLGIFGGVIAAFGRRWGSNYILTNKGQELAGQIIGLRNYLLDFSNFKDRGVPDLTLWDRYLVYATAFGISEKVAKQLALSAPQIQDPQWLYSNYTIYPLLFVSYHRWAWDLPNGSGGSSTSFGPFNSNFGANSGIGNLGNQLQSNIHSIQSTVTHALNVPSDSSGSGSSGGSFSGGGFGGSGGGFGGGSFGAR